MKIRHYTQTLIIGSGLAGCTAALMLADRGIDVLLLSATDDVGGGNSELAQGGIIYKAQAHSTNDADNATASNNDAEALARDIYIAGHHHNYDVAVQHLCTKGPKIIEELLLDRVRVPFDTRADGTWHLTREGGHSTSRILHKADYTGKTIMDSLAAAVKAHPRITCLCHAYAIDLLTSRHHGRASSYRYDVENRCVGAYVYNSQLGQSQTILADWTVLATGGVGRIFLHSTNAASCVGGGISMAHRAQVALANVEFMQFHPTALYSKLHQRRPLITEAMRGEGACLIDAHGDDFMKRYDVRGALAPRDIVSQAMVAEMLHTGAPCLYLDARHIDADLTTRFPTVLDSCLEIGVDIRQEPIPVVPAAHYFCGGILTDTRGRTSLHGLYAIGECACTGVHGANRLASTSLLEAVTWGYESALDIAERAAYEAGLPKSLQAVIPNWDPVGDENNDDPALIAQDWATIRHTMWNYVGITRSTARLRRAFLDFRELLRHIHDFYKRTHISPPLINLFHGVHTASVITQAALRNTESKGCHYRIS